MEPESSHSARTPPQTGAPGDPQATRLPQRDESAMVNDAPAASDNGSADAPAADTGDEQATLVDGQPVASLSAPRRRRITSPPASSPALPPDGAAYQDFGPPAPPQWQPPRAVYGPPARPQHPSHVPWQVAQSWGPTTLSIDAHTAAGASYLLWWLSGVLVYFNERNNRYVRFHAVQAILLTSALTVLGVLAYILAALGHDLGHVTHWTVFAALGNGIALLTVPFIILIWLIAMVSAWTGHDLHWPIVGSYAERYASPPIQQPSSPPVS